MTEFQFFRLRIPNQLAKMIEDRAWKNRRSMNAEVITLLEKALGWEGPSLAPETPAGRGAKKKSASREQAIAMGYIAGMKAADENSAQQKWFEHRDGEYDTPSAKPRNTKMPSSVALSIAELIQKAIDEGVQKSIKESKDTGKT